MSENSLLAKIEGLHSKFASIQEQISDPAVMGDMKKYVQLNKEYKELAPILEAGDKYKKMVEDYEAAHKLHEEMGCICYENPAMGIYFITDPDGYWLEIVPARKK